MSLDLLYRGPLGLRATFGEGRLERVPRSLERASVARVMPGAVIDPGRNAAEGPPRGGVE